MSQPNISYFDTLRRDFGTPEVITDMAQQVVDSARGATLPFDPFRRNVQQFGGAIINEAPELLSPLLVPNILPNKDNIKSFVGLPLVAETASHYTEQFVRVVAFRVGEAAVCSLIEPRSLKEWYGYLITPKWRPVGYYEKEHFRYRSPAAITAKDFVEKWALNYGKQASRAYQAHLTREVTDQLQAEKAERKVARRQAMLDRLWPGSSQSSQSTNTNNQGKETN